MRRIANCANRFSVLQDVHPRVTRNSRSALSKTTSVVDGGVVVGSLTQAALTPTPSTA
ncbi:hypothetical protein ACX9NE_15335 [Mycobacterium sp. ML4]